MERPIVAKVICFRHPSYNPETPPDLSCKRCCSIFVSNIKLKQERKKFATPQWNFVDASENKLSDKVVHETSFS